MKAWMKWLAAASVSLAGAAWADAPYANEADRQRDPFGPQQPGTNMPRDDIGTPPGQSAPQQGWPGTGGTGTGGAGVGDEGETIPPEDIEILPAPVPEEGIDGAETDELGTQGDAQPGTGGAGDEGTEPQVVPPENGEAIRAIPDDATGGAGDGDPMAPRGMRGLMSPPDDMRGVSVLVGGGIEGYTGDFAPNIDPGISWSAVADIRPWRVIGFELGYSGGANEIDPALAPGAEGAAGGMDLTRHGGHASVIVSAPTPLQPYVMGGIGIDRYTFRGPDGLYGFRDDTSGSLPLAAGLRANVGDVVADFRLGYEPMIDQDFSPVPDRTFTEGRYNGIVQVGGTF